MKNVTVLGSTGSIGTQTLDVCRNLGYKITALAANRNIDLLEKQVREFMPEFVAVADNNAYAELKERLKDLNVTLAGGDDSAEQAASLKCDTVLNAVTGIAGLKPTLAAIRAHNNIALANKETLVAGGEKVMEYARENGVTIYPVDSEHSAIFQCIQAKGDYGRIKRLILTASGGPFFGRSSESLSGIKPEEALNHPTWNMGRKVTIDSATMANKGLEIIEAAHLFGISQDRIDVLIHRESIVHSLVEFADNSVLAQLGVPDMRTPIQYALTCPERFNGLAKQLNLSEIGCLHFYRQDEEAFPSTALAREALKIGRTAPAAFNAADEVAVDAFLNGNISFMDIPKIIEKTLYMDLPHEYTFESVFYTDKQARKYARDIIEKGI